MGASQPRQDFGRTEFVPLVTTEIMIGEQVGQAALRKIKKSAPTAAGKWNESANATKRAEFGERRMEAMRPLLDGGQGKNTITKHWATRRRPRNPVKATKNVAAMRAEVSAGQERRRRLGTGGIRVRQRR